MKTIGKNLRTLLAILLCLAMVFCMSACGNKDVVSEPEIVYGNEVDDGFGDEDVVGNAGASDTVDTNADQNTANSNAGNSSDNKNNAATN
ncbi:MAG: hypothetical protein J6D52_07580, partial [Clostridia bacterium]|nr:hypothetical protein [Clostridia bacterium]